MAIMALYPEVILISRFSVEQSFVANRKASMDGLKRQKMQMHTQLQCLFFQKVQRYFAVRDLNHYPAPCSMGNN